MFCISSRRSLGCSLRLLLYSLRRKQLSKDTTCERRCGKHMEEENTPQEKATIDIPWFKRWEDKDTTPPDPDFVARLEELEYK